MAERTLLDHKESELTVKQILIRAAAEAYFACADPPVVMKIASENTATWVQNVRSQYVDYGFSDDDLRQVHDTIRHLVVRKLLHGDYDKLRVN